MIEVDIVKRFAAPRDRRPPDEAQGVVVPGRAVSGIEVAFTSRARVLALFGRSGSGKTTVVNALAGLLHIDRGRIVVDGETLFDSSRGIEVPVERRGIGYVFQDGLLFPHMNVRRNLLYGAGRGSDAGRPGRSVPFDQVVALLGIEGLLERPAPSLSGGEKQRVAIGRALLSKPRLLLMDEPLASLDSGRRGEILRLIERVRDELGVNIVYVSHSIGEVSRLADEVALMNEGRMVACGVTEDIFNRADLRPLTGRFEGGALIEAHAIAHDMRYFLTRFAFSGGELVAPGVDTPIGARVRLRIRARDVALATVRPQGLSIRNVLEGQVGHVADRGGAIVEVHVNVGGRDLLARISRQALDELALQPGQPVFALIKAIAFDKRSMGFTT